MRDWNNKTTTFKKKEAEKYIQEVFKNIFTTSQLDLLLRKKKKVTWTEADISIAFTLRYYSRRCYVFLRQKLNYPLPGKIFFIV